MATSMADVQNEDNEILLQTIREHVKYLRSIAQPTLALWQSQLINARAILEEELANSSQTSKKRRPVESSSLSSSSR